MTTPRLIVLFSISLWAGAVPNEVYLKVLPLEPTVVPAKSHGQITLKLEVVPGFHIQSNPASSPNLIATSVKIDGPHGILWGQITYPPGKPYRLVGATHEISTYDGKLALNIPFTISSTKKGRLVGAGKVKYQACNDKTCFFPQTLTFEVPFKAK